MKQLAIITLVFFLFILEISSSELLCPDYVTPGEGFTLFMYGDSSQYTKGEVTIVGDEGKIKARSQFFLLPLENDESVWCSLLGVPSLLPPGRYTLTCQMEGVGGSETFQKKIALTDQDFPSEELPLSTSLTNIRTKEDPEKVIQAQKLWSTYASFDRTALYTQGRFVKPMVEHRTTTRFGTRRIYVYSDGKRAESVHNGEDWAGPTGTPINSVGHGKVLMAENRIVTGNTIIVELLPGVLMVYFHLDELLVIEGQMVEAGQIVGRLGMTGLATGPHLHWELRISKVAVDPLSFFEGPLIDKTLLMAKIGGTL